MNKIIHYVSSEACNFARNYTGDLFHCIFCDAPYHLQSTTKRFENSTSKNASTPMYQRFANGFLGHSWDGGDVSFRADTWASFARLLHPGGYIATFASSNSWHLVAEAMEDAGLIVLDKLFYWVTLSGNPKTRKFDSLIGRRLGNANRTITKQFVLGNKSRYLSNSFGYVNHTGSDYTISQPDNYHARIWSGYRYGQQALKPSAEPIIVSMLPYKGLSPVDSDIWSTLIGQQLSSADPFIYSPKASTSERNAGLGKNIRNVHPTIKPLAVTKKIAELLLPPFQSYRRRLLVPFAGVGSEMIGAVMAGFEDVVGIELPDDKRNNIYAHIASARIKHWVKPICCEKRKHEWIYTI